jgi:hypothetical protein
VQKDSTFQSADRDRKCLCGSFASFGISGRSSCRSLFPTLFVTCWSQPLFPLPRLFGNGILIEAKNAILLGARLRRVLEGHIRKNIMLYQLPPCNELDKYSYDQAMCLRLATLNSIHWLLSMTPVLEDYRTHTVMPVNCLCPPLQPPTQFATFALFSSCLGVFIAFSYTLRTWYSLFRAS